MPKTLTENRIRVIRKSDGVSGTILEKDFDPTIYEIVKGELPTRTDEAIKIEQGVPEQETPGFLGKISRFLGVDPLGRYLGSQLIRLTPEGKMLREMREKGEISEEQYQDIVTGGVTPKQAAASAAIGLLTTALPAGRVGRFLMPAGAKLGTLMGRSAILGTSFGGLGAVSEKKEKDLIPRMVTGAVFGGAVPVAGRLLTEAGGIIKEFPEALVKRVFPTSKKDILEKAIAKATGKPENPVLAKELIDRGFVGGYEKMLVMSIQNINRLENQLQSRVQASSQLIDVPLNTIKKAIKVAISGYREGLLDIHAKRGNEILKQLNRHQEGKIPISLALETKRFLDKTLPHSSWRLNARLAPKTAGIKEIVNQIRSKIGEADPEIKKLLNEERIFIRARDVLVDQLYKEQNRRIVSWIDAVLGGGGAMMGAPGKGLGAMVGIRAFQRPGTLTRLGVGLQKGVIEPTAQLFGRSLPGGTTLGEEAQKAIRTLTYPAIKQITE